MTAAGAAGGWVDVADAGVTPGVGAAGPAGLDGTPPEGIAAGGVVVADLASGVPADAAVFGEVGGVAADEATEGVIPDVRAGEVAAEGVGGVLDAEGGAVAADRDAGDTPAPCAVADGAVPGMAVPAEAVVGADGAVAGVAGLDVDAGTGTAAAGADVFGVGTAGTAGSDPADDDVVAFAGSADPVGAAPASVEAAEVDPAGASVIAAEALEREDAGTADEADMDPVCAGGDGDVETIAGGVDDATSGTGRAADGTAGAGDVLATSGKVSPASLAGGCSGGDCRLASRNAGRGGSGMGATLSASCSRDFSSDERADGAAWINGEADASSVALVDAGWLSCAGVENGCAAASLLSAGDGGSGARGTGTGTGSGLRLGSGCEAVAGMPSGTSGIGTPVP